jgi:hypothetical protein
VSDGSTERVQRLIAAAEAAVADAYEEGDNLDDESLAELVEQIRPELRAILAEDGYPGLFVAITTLRETNRDALLLVNAAMANEAMQAEDEED